MHSSRRVITYLCNKNYSNFEMNKCLIHENNGKYVRKLKNNKNKNDLFNQSNKFSLQL